MAWQCTKGQETACRELDKDAFRGRSPHDQILIGSWLICRVGNGVPPIDAESSPCSSIKSAEVKALQDAHW